MKLADINVGAEYAVRPTGRPVLCARVIEIRENHTVNTVRRGPSTGTWVFVTEVGAEGPRGRAFHVKPNQVRSPWDHEVSKREAARAEEVSRLRVQQRADAMARALRDALMLHGFDVTVQAARWGGRVSISMDVATCNRLTGWVSDVPRQLAS